MAKTAKESGGDGLDQAHSEDILELFPLKAYSFSGR